MATDTTTPFITSSWSYTHDATITPTSTWVGTFDPLTLGSGTGTVWWNSPADERKAIWERLSDIMLGKGDLSLDDIEQLIELQTIHGEVLGLLRFVLEERGDR